MNIPKININSNIFFYNNPKKNSLQNSTSFGLKLSSPLPCDTVTFRCKKSSKATRKALSILEETLKKPDTSNITKRKVCNATKKTRSNEEKKGGVNGTTAKKIRKFGLESQPAIDAFIEKVFGKYVYSDKNPNGIITHIGGRVKSIFSIQQKSQGRNWNDYETYIKEGTDLNGKNIILKANATKSQVSAMLDELIPYIRSKKVSIIEIENKRPSIVDSLDDKSASLYDYAYINKLKLLIDTQNNVNKGKNQVKYKLEDDFTDGYTAIHILLKLPNSNVFELQIYGEEVARWKHVDDVVYKVINNKEPDPIYKPICKSLSSLTQDENADLLNEFNRYRSDGFLWQRIKEIQASQGNYEAFNSDQPFLALDRYDLEPKYAYKTIEQDVIRCDNKAMTNKVNLEKANKAKENIQTEAKLLRSINIQNRKKEEKFS